jgi:hypothetical protein
VTPAERILHCRKHVRAAHEEIVRAIAEPHDPATDRLIDALHSVGTVLAALVDVAAEMAGEP